MLISLAWLEELLGGERLDADEVEHQLTGLGLEVERVERVGEELAGIVVGEVRAIMDHPTAERLSVVSLNDGTDTIQVVCGAGNLPPPGGKVAFAPVGTRLPGGLEIAARAIRGIDSRGMICSEAELAIGPDASGIVVLPEGWPVGRGLCDLVSGMRDWVFELSVTPNRPDALGHVGVARDLAVKLELPLSLPETPVPDVRDEPELVTLAAADRCGRYYGYALTAARVGPSPLPVRVRLHRLGLRPINNVVDVTNLVLMEWGQPLHAFDRSRLHEGRVVVRTARDGEPMTTLDDRLLELTMDDLVIADADRPQALAGVMGGLGSAVEIGSTELLLEAAWFQPAGVRRSARRHALHTDSSHRFERGVDHGEGLRRAALRAVDLLGRFAGAQPLALHVTTGELPRVPVVRFRPARAGRILGVDVADQEAERILTGLGIAVDRSDITTWRCTPPTHRPDLGREEDLVEEVMRHHGLDDLPARASAASETTVPEPPSPRVDLRERLIDALVGAGVMEAMPLVFCGERELVVTASDVPVARAVALANPMRAQASYLRTHLLPGLLELLAVNVSRHGRPVRVFELGRVYDWHEQPPTTGQGPTAEIDALLPRERERAGILLFFGREDTDRGRAARRAGGLLIHVLERLGFAAELLPADVAPADWLHPGVQAAVAVRGNTGAEVVGVVGEVHPDVLQKWDLAADVRPCYGEIRLERLPTPSVARFDELPRFPATSRDLSLELPVSIPASVVLDALREAAAVIEQEERSPPQRASDPPRLAAGDSSSAAIEVMEDYRGDGIATGSRALLLRLHYRARGRSITDAEVDRLHEAVIARAAGALDRAAAGRIRRR